jgi:hypothetical protein
MGMGSNQPVRESSNRSTWKGKGGQGEALTTLQIPCAYCIEIRDPQLSETLRSCKDTWRNCFTFLPLLMAITLLVRTATCLVASERVYSGWRKTQVFYLNLFRRLPVKHVFQNHCIAQVNNTVMIFCGL